MGKTHSKRTEEDMMTQKNGRANWQEVVVTKLSKAFDTVEVLTDQLRHEITVTEISQSMAAHQQYAQLATYVLEIANDSRAHTTSELDELTQSAHVSGWLTDGAYDAIAEFIIYMDKPY